MEKSKLSFWAIVVIACNTMNGPGLTTLPSIGNSAGKVTFSILVILATFVTSFVVKRLCSVIWSQKHYRFGHDQDPDIVCLSDRLFHQKKAASIAMFGCALSLVSSIRVVSMPKLYESASNTPIPFRLF